MRERLFELERYPAVLLLITQSFKNNFIVLRTIQSDTARAENSTRTFGESDSIKAKRGRH